MPTIETHWTSTLATTLAAGATRVLLYGPPGTGKTTAATRILSRYHRVTLHADSVADDLAGGFRLRTVNGGTETYWSAGPAARAMREGSTLVLDEIDHAGSAITSTLHAVLDDSDIARLAQDGDTVAPAPGYRVIATMNGNPSDLAPPVLDRFECVIHAPDACADALAEIPEALRRTLTIPEPTFATAPTPRRLRSLARLVDAGLSRETAAEVVFGTSAATILTVWSAAR